MRLKKRRVRSCLSHLPENKPCCENGNSSRNLGSLLLKKYLVLDGLIATCSWKKGQIF